MTSQELSRLIDAHLEDRLTSAEAEALSEILVRDAGARRQFWEQSAVHGLLPEAAQLEWLGQAAPEPERNVVRVNWWRRIAPFAAAAAVAVLALVWWNRSPGERVTNGVAVLSRAVGAHWMDAADERVSGAVLSPGMLRLKSGAVLVEFFSGARVVVEGPAEFQLVSAQEAFLRAGQVSAHVPPQARGFTVGSPAGRVVDLGTEFGLAVRDAGTAEVHVFSGKVEMNTTGPTTARQSLNGGEAMRLVSGAWNRAPANRAAFLSEAELARRGDANSAQRLAAWRVASRAWSADGVVDDQPRVTDFSLALHYRFEEAAAERVLMNSVAGASAESHGSIVGCAWGEGRWPGKRALEFRGEGDRVRLTGPESLLQVTFLAWVRVEALPNGMHALFSAEAERVGALRWELTRTGQLRLNVGRDLGRRRLDWEAVNSEPFVTPERLGQWLLLTTTFDGKTIRHYGNDRLIGTGASFTPPTLHVGTAELGNSPNRDVRQLVGSMDEFAVLSRALSEAEVRDFFEQGKP